MKKKCDHEKVYEQCLLLSMPPKQRWICLKCGKQGEETIEVIKTWNKEFFERRYKRTLEEAKERGFTDEDLKSHYLTRLSYQTKSRRIMRMITLAYYLGKLCSISEIDEGFTPITIREEIE